ncbi:MAG TPA: CHASE4 domain-containing protein [Kouleothrix sp.]|uniref:sensor histidine kinase n=1 Tax=Kouleothrix sp. TaxID=2779161 RepID=UPI002BCED380|nr:CHASE4 domain-containing protein [Kouleothrix sp.]HRC74459.1 CHASE4 domain-containing protein [Kouleothrix sp.]
MLNPTESNQRVGLRPRVDAISEQRLFGQKRFVALRFKILFLLGVGLLGLLVALALPLRLLILESYVTLEQQTLRTELGRAHDAFKIAVTKLDHSATGYATWDNSYAFVQDHNENFLNVDLADPSFPAEDMNLLLIVDTNGQLVGGKAYDLANGRAMPIPGYFRQPTVTQSALFKHNALDSAINGFVLLPEGPMLVASRPILTSDGHGPIRGALLIGRFLDAGLVRQLADTTHLQLNIVKLDDAQLISEASELSKNQPEQIHALSTQSIIGYSLLSDVYGQPNLAIRVEMPRNIYSQGVSTVNYFVIALIVVVVVSCGAGMLGFERLVISRVSKLDARAHAIGASGDLSLRMETQGNDELTRLSYSINTMLTDLERAQVRRRQADELRAQTQEELLRSREQFSQMLVHDLKTPLTAVLGYLDILLMTELSEDQQSVVAGAQLGAKSGLMLVSQILDVARLSEGRLEIRREPADIMQMLNTCAEELRSWVELEQKKIDVAPSPAFPPLLVDISLLQRVINNLVSNAVKHTPVGTLITLGTRHTEANVQIIVHDNGPGIAPERLPHLFERFSVTSPDGTRQSNTGLGLAFCKLAVEAHGGTITVLSSPGNGSTFVIAFPLDAIAYASD